MNTKFENQIELRLWPGITLLALQWLVRFVVPFFVSDTTVLNGGIFGGMLIGLAILVWWAFFSRAQRLERWGGSLLIIISLVIASQLLHHSIETAMAGMMFIIYSIPLMSLVFVTWTVAAGRLPEMTRRITMAAVIVVGAAILPILRTEGISGDTKNEFAWRWAKTAEEIFLEQLAEEPLAAGPAAGTVESSADWTGFRGANRDGKVHGVQVATDWSAAAPEELWRRKIGPGCSSFAIVGNFFFTQEQHGDKEIVSCYSMISGQPVWRHSDPARFWDSHAGAGPRSTPTISGGKVYALGATGILNVLNMHDGSVIWSRNAADDTEVKIPGWGYTSSPVVADDVVIVAISGTVAAFDLDTGNPRWFGPDTVECYSSPHLMTIDGIPQVLMMSNFGVTSYNPPDGEVLWKHSSPGVRIIQPAQAADGDILFSIGGRRGVRRISAELGPEGWITAEKWLSRGLRPDFNDFIIHEGYVYGLDGPVLACIDLENGRRMWKGGRYGGQLVLLTEQDLLLNLTESGGLVLVEAKPDKYTELSHIPAIEGKTWNHPALANGILLVRNAIEIVALRLPSVTS